MASQFEKFTPKSLRKICQRLLEFNFNTNIKTEVMYEDNYDLFSEVMKGFGPVLWEDMEFFYQLMDLNPEIITNNNIESTSPLRMPKFQEYRINYSFVEEIQNRHHFEITHPSYHGDLAELGFGLLYANGDFDCWEGEQRDTDEIDSSVDNFEIENVRLVEKIKESSSKEDLIRLKKLIESKLKSL